MKKFSRFTCNLLPKGCRVDTLEGREYTVVPMVILTEGVHTGSQGALYYPSEELSKTPAVWNHKPVVVYHPSMNGESVSACDPVIINSRKVGIMLNTKFEGGKLKSEAWIEKPRAEVVDNRVMEAVDNKKVMELSTGMFIDVEETTGTWKGEDYTGIARNFRPDHLALLPDQIGACSVADGAGFLRNAVLVGNEMSFGNISSQLMAALRKKFNVNADSGPFVWVADVFSNFVIYEKDGKLWRLGYMSNDSGVTLSDETPTEVVRATEYRTTDGSFVGNQPRPQQAAEPMNKKQIIAALVAANVGLVEADTPMLEEMNEVQLDTLHSIHKQMPTVNIKVEKKDGKVTFIVKAKPEEPKTVPVNVATPPAAPVTASAAAPVANAQPPAAQPANVVTVADFIKQAPKEMQEVLNNSMAVYNSEKAKLVELILANKNNSFTKEMLQGKDIGELQAIARLAAPEVPAHNRLAPNYAGQASVPTTNEEEAMPIPVMDFSKRN